MAVDDGRLVAGRLSLAGRTPDLFTAPPDAPGLSRAESAAVAEARRLIDAVGTFDDDGFSLSCVGGIDAAEAVRWLVRRRRPGRGNPAYLPVPGRAVAYCCAYVDVRPVDSRPFTGRPDLWVRLPVPEPRAR